MVELDTIWTRRRKKANERLNICIGCDRYISLSDQCGECGCFMKIKTLWPSASCPLNKWTADEDKEESHNG